MNCQELSKATILELWIEYNTCSIQGRAWWKLDEEDGKVQSILAVIVTSYYPPSTNPMAGSYVDYIPCFWYNSLESDGQ